MRALIPTSPRLRSLALALLLSAAPHALAAQAAASDPAASGPLYDTLARLDSVLFDAVFVSCNAARVNGMLTEDTEFYHDRNGPMAGQQVRDQFASVTASCPARAGIRREVVPGSLRAYPMDRYGAVQTGAHRFLQPNGDPPVIARFVHLWHQVDGEWKLARVLSFDHRPDTAPPAAHRDE